MHPDQAALYRGILANPHADLPRLVYADWLEENSRAERAEFIRVQIELANATPADDGYYDLLEREYELQTTLRDELEADLKDFELPSWLYVSTERRGFLSHIGFRGDNAAEAYDDFAERFEPLAECMPSFYLSIHPNEEKDPAPLLQLLQRPICERLTALYASPSGPGIASRLLDAIAHSPHLKNLEHLDLFADLDDEEFDRLATLRTLPALRSLDLRGRNLVSTAASFARASWRATLRRLVFSNMGCDYPNRVGRTAFPELQCLKLPSLPTPALAGLLSDPALYPNLLRLSLTSVGAGTPDSPDDVGLLDVPLRDLSVLGFPYSEHAFRRFIQAPGMKPLRKLSLSWEVWTANHIEAVQDAGLEYLRHLDLTTMFDGPAVLALATASFWKSITQAYISHLGDDRHPDEWRQFFHQINATRLRKLVVSSLALGFPGGLALAQNRSLANLRTLILCECGLDDGAVRAILTAPQFQRLHFFRVWKTTAGDGFRVLLNPDVLPDAVRIDLDKTGIPPRLADKLRARPGVVIR